MLGTSSKRLMRAACSLLDEPGFRAASSSLWLCPRTGPPLQHAVERETKTAAGKELQFAISPSMTSYLNVFCAGELDAIEKKSGGVLHRVLATKGKAEMGRYALDSSAQIVEFYTTYFGTPYRLAELDHIAVPAASAVR